MGNPDETDEEFRARVIAAGRDLQLSAKLAGMVSEDVVAYLSRLEREELEERRREEGLLPEPQFGSAIAQFIPPPDLNRVRETLIASIREEAERVGANVEFEPAGEDPMMVRALVLMPPKFVEYITINFTLSEPKNTELPQWAQDHMAVKEELNAEAIDWIRSRPPVVRDLMLKFPPSCLVRANTPLRHPAPGVIGKVVSYLENGNVRVVDGPDGDVAAECQPHWLEVVGYWNGVTPDRVREILKSGDTK